MISERDYMKTPPKCGDNKPPMLNSKPAAAMTVNEKNSMCLFSMGAIIIGGGVMFCSVNGPQNGGDLWTLLEGGAALLFLFGILCMFLMILMTMNPCAVGTIEEIHQFISQYHPIKTSSFFGS